MENYYKTKSGEKIPESKIDGVVERNGKTIIQYTKYAMLAGILRKMVCYEEAKKIDGGKKAIK